MYAERKVNQSLKKKRIWGRNGDLCEGFKLKRTLSKGKDTLLFKSELVSLVAQPSYKQDLKDERSCDYFVSNEQFFWP